MVVHAKDINEGLEDGVDFVEREQTLVFMDKPCVVEKVQITGLNKTKKDFVVGDLKRVMNSKSFVSAYQSALECKARLLHKGIFDDVEIVMDTTAHYSGNKSQNGLQVLFRAKEKRSLTGETRTEMSTNEQPFWVVRLMSPNVFGRGEMLTASFSRKFGSVSSGDDGTFMPNDFNFSAVKPFNNGSLVRLSILKDKQDCPWNSTYLVNRGAQVEYEFPLFNNAHKVSWQGHWRELGSLNSTTAFPVREEFGHSLKSSILHSVTVDRTDDKILPSKGYLIKMMEEVAGIGTGDKHIKENFDFQFHKTFFDLLTISAGCRGGFIALLGASEPRIMDKFFIGGPMTLRGFEMNRVGPQVDGDFLGGNCYWLTGLHVYLPLPFYWKRFGSGSWLDGFRVHAFVNAGNVLSFDSQSRIKEQLPTLFNNVRVSYGVGLVYNFMRSARLELNFCIPHTAFPGDKFCDGIQFGIGISNV